MYEFNSPGTQLPDKPSELTVISVLALISGIVNILCSVVLVAFSVTSLLTFACVCVPVAILALALGIVEIVYAAQLLNLPNSDIRPSTTIAALEIATILYLNVFSLVVGILSLVLKDNLRVKNYFQQLENAKQRTQTVSLPSAPE